MNWPRGLWRLWLVLTLIWVIAIAIYERPDRAVRTYWEARDAIAPAPAPRRSDVPTPSDILAGLHRTVRTAEMREAGRELERFAWRALLPPAAVLLLGCGGLWAYRGFRRP